MAIHSESAAKTDAKLVNVYGSHALSDSAIGKRKRDLREGRESVRVSGTCREAEDDGHGH